MKGTIDIQIKRKDGTIENRHEHNVVFDIPSLTFKKWSESPLAIITGLPTSQVVLTGDKFKAFALFLKILYPPRNRVLFLQR